jgi:hypothetical protein
MAEMFLVVTQAQCRQALHRVLPDVVDRVSWDY